MPDAVDQSNRNSSVSGKYKAIIYANPPTLETKIVELDIPKPGPGEVLVKLTHSGVCHSDAGIIAMKFTHLPYPTVAGQIGGHEGVGEVVSHGSDVASPKIGSRVGIKWLASACLKCEACLLGIDASCPNQKVSGYYTPGTFQQYVLAPANYVTPIPDGISSAEAAPMLCGGVTVWAALKKAKLAPGDWVIIAGAGGGLGHLAVQFAKNSFSSQVIAIDRGEKEQFCKDLGATVFIDFMKFDDEGLIKKVKEVTGGLGAHAIIVASASQKSYDQGIDFLRTGGRMICVGLPEGDPQPIAGATAAKLVAGSKVIIGSAVGNRLEAMETLEAAAKGDAHSTVRIEKMDKLTEVFYELEEGKLQGRVVLDLS